MPDENGEQEDAATFWDSQNWICGPFGFWPLLGCPPVGVSWGYTVARVAAAARL
jgi:hypothetical protein